MKKLISLKKSVCALTILGTLGTGNFASAGPSHNGQCEFMHSRSKVVFAVMPAPTPTANDGGCGSLTIPVHSHYGGFRDPRSIIDPVSKVETHSHDHGHDHKHKHENKLTQVKQVKKVSIKKPGFSEIMSAHDVEYVPPPSSRVTEYSSREPRTNVRLRSTSFDSISRDVASLIEYL